MKMYETPLGKLMEIDEIDENVWNYIREIDEMYEKTSLFKDSLTLTLIN